MKTGCPRAAGFALTEGDVQKLFRFLVISPVVYYAVAVGVVPIGMGNTKSSGEDAQYAFALIFGGNGHIGIIAGHGSQAAGDPVVLGNPMVSCGIADQKGIGGIDKLLRGGNRVKRRRTRSCSAAALQAWR